MAKSIDQSGFSLIELLIAMAISGVLLAGMVTAFTGQSRGYNTQQEISILQEDLRASLALMASEIRMAGWNPQASANTQIVKATETELIFTADINGDGNYNLGGPDDDPNEIIRYQINTSGSLGRATGLAVLTTGGTLQPMAENTEHLAFEYLLDDGSWKTTPDPDELEDIRAVKIAVMARSARPISKTADTSSFRPPLAVPPEWKPATPGGYMRRMMSVVVQCRNL